MLEEKYITQFDCEKDLTPYTDSMLFDSGTNIATMIWEDDKYKIEQYLDIVGDVKVWFEDKYYTQPSEFPKELRDIIKQGNCWYDGISLNNWFETIFKITDKETGKNWEDGGFVEGSLEEDTPETIKKYLLENGEVLINSYKEFFKGEKIK